MSRSLVYALLAAHLGAAASVGFAKRDAPFIPQRVNIPLSFDSLGRYVATVSMGSNPGQQHFNFTMTTQTGLTYVAGAHCGSCSGTSLYDQSKSKTAQSFSSASDANVLGQPALASIIKEDCQLRLVNNSLWDYPNQTIVIVNQPDQGSLAQASDAQVGTGLAGLIGLATNRQTPSTSGNSSLYNAQFGDSIAGQWLNQHPTADNFTFGMQLGKPQTTPRSNASSGSWLNTQNNDPGVLHWLQPDPTAYDTSKVVWVDAGLATSQTPFTNSTGDWYVSLDGWVLNSGSNQISNSRSVVATVDPMYPDLYLPLDQAKLIHDAIPGAILHPDLSSVGTLSQAWTIPCNSSFSFGIVVGDQTFTLSESDLILQQLDGSCVSAIEAWTDADQTHYVFGAQFLSTIYLIFNIPRGGSNSMGFAPRSSGSGKSNHIGAIVGGTIGGVAFVVIVGFAVFFLVYRHRQGSHRITRAQYDDGQEIEKPEGTVQPFPLSATTPTTVRFMHAAESSVLSDGLSSPSSVPMLGHYDDSTLEVAPPSYEISEAIRHSQSHLPLPSARSEKANLGARYGNASTSQSPPQSPLSLPVEDPGEASGSNTMV